MARAKVWLRDDVHQDSRRLLRVGDDVRLNVAYSDRLYVESRGGSTAMHGRLVGIEWHERTAEGYGPGVRVETADDFTHEPDYAYELTVATKDWLPHA